MALGVSSCFATQSAQCSANLAAICSLRLSLVVCFPLLSAWPTQNICAPSENLPRQLEAALDRVQARGSRGVPSVANSGPAPAVQNGLQRGKGVGARGFSHLIVLSCVLCWVWETDWNKPMHKSFDLSVLAVENQTNQICRCSPKWAVAFNHFV